MDLIGSLEPNPIGTKSFLRLRKSLFFPQMLSNSANKSLHKKSQLGTNDLQAISKLEISGRLEPC